MKPIGSHNYFVYILTNLNKTTLYIGVTNDIKIRIYHHRNPGIVDKLPFATRYKCFYLIYFERFQWIYDAIDREKQLKRWSRSKKEKLIASYNPKWEFLNDKLNEW